MRKEWKRTYKNKGITMIALIVTIIILIILVGVSIAFFGGNGIIDRAKQASFMTTIAALEERVHLIRFANFDNKKTNKEIIPNLGEITTEEKDKIVEDIGTLNETIKKVTNGQDVYQRPLYWLDVKMLEGKEPSKKYIIDMKNLKVYDYEGDKFLNDTWHTIGKGLEDNTEGDNNNTGGGDGEEVPPGFISLNLTYPDGSINRQWRLGAAGEIRDDENLMWKDYIDCIVVPIERIEDIWIRYDIDGVNVIVPPIGNVLVDIQPDKTIIKEGEISRIKIIFEVGSIKRQYKINESGWIDYNGEFQVAQETVIEARASKIVNVTDEEGNVIGTAETMGNDKIKIKVNIEVPEKPENPELLPPTLSKVIAVGSEKARVNINYPNITGTKKIYTVNYGVEQEYTTQIPITQWGTNVTAYYYTTDGKKSPQASISIVAEPSKIDVAIYAKPDPTITKEATNTTIYIEYGKEATKKQYRIDGGETKNYTGSFIVTKDCTIEAIASNIEGGSGNVTKAIKFYEVKEPRITAKYTNNSKKAEVQVTYDEIAKERQYRINNGEWKTYTQALEVTKNNTIIEASCKDLRGQVKKSTFTVNEIIPIQAPKITYKISADKKKATVQIAYDEEVATSKKYKIGEGELIDYTGSFEVTKNNIVVYAENTTKEGESANSSQDITGIAELEKPVITQTLSENKKSATIHIEYDKNAITKKYKIGEEALKDYTEDFTITKNGMIIYAENTDDKGSMENTTYITQEIVPIEKPEITFEMSEDNLTAIVEIKYDKVSAVSKKYKIGEGELKDYTGPFEITQNNTTIYAENTTKDGERQSNTTIINGLGEKLNVTISANPEGETIVEKVTVTINYDNRAETKEYSINGEALKTYTGPFEITENCTIIAIAKHSRNGLGQVSKKISNLPKGLIQPTFVENRLKENEGDYSVVTINYDKNATIKQYSINGGELLEYTGGITVRENGTIIQAYSADKFGYTAQASFTVKGLKRYVLIDKGMYYWIKLSYPSKSTNQEYKYTATGDWETYPKDGFILVKPEYEAELIQNPDLVRIEVELGVYVDFTGHWYIVNKDMNTMTENIYMRWKDGANTNLQPVQIVVAQKQMVEKVDVIVLYPQKARTRQYKINDGAWIDYTNQLQVTEAGTKITARAQYEDGSWSKEISKIINNIIPGTVTKITNAQELSDIRNNTNGEYMLANDIDVSSFSNWTPIPTFTGKLYGNGKTIKNLTSTTGGLFATFGINAFTSNVTIENINIKAGASNIGGLAGSIEGTGVVIEGITISGTIEGNSTALGGLIGRSYQGAIITNCKIEANLIGKYYTGGIIGSSNSDTITNCIMAGDITAIGSHTGGIMGRTEGTVTIDKCSMLGNITKTGTSGDYTGGIAGNLVATGKISQSYAGAIITTSTMYIGGIVGENAGIIENCYSTGKITTRNYVGGIAGYCNSSAKKLIKDCYTVVEIVDPNTYKGPIITSDVATLNNAYYIVEGSKMVSNYAENIGGKKINTYVEGAKQNTYTGFDFATIWEIKEGKTTPYLKGMEIPSQVYLSNITNKYQGEGQGTVENPYKIKTAEELMSIGSSPSAKFEIVNEIDANGIANWTPIIRFMGELDGKGNKIKNLTSTNGGIFLALENDAMIKNITIENINIKAGVSNIGGLAGSINGTGVVIEGITISGIIEGNSTALGGLIGRSYQGAIITNCKIEANLIGKYYTGGIIGSSNSDTITNCIMAGNITATGSHTGGIMGRTEGTVIIDKCSMLGNITKTGTSGDYTGGIVGNLVATGKISQSYAGAIITTSTMYVGGIVGENVGTIENCYSTGKITSGNYVGGIAGYCNSSAKELIKDCYTAVEIVNPNTYKGPITSTTVATLNNAYYIVEGSKIVSSYAENIGGKKIDTYTEGARQNTYTGFDFSTIWEIQEGKTTPYLKGMEIPTEVYLSNITNKYQGEGQGTVENPYKIKTAEELMSIGSSPSAKFEIVNEIDASGIANWTPIIRFMGELDGKGNKIKNLISTNGGIFLALENNGNIENLTIENININIKSISSDIGGLAGSINGTGVIIDGITISGIIQNTSSNVALGGVIGRSYQGAIIANCKIEANLIGTYNVGGIVGIGKNDTITNCIMAGDITATGSHTGGIMGRTEGTVTIEKCSMLGNITKTGTSGDYTGGIAGNLVATGKISKSYAGATITTSTRYVGGIVGENVGTIENCYSTGKITSGNYAGGIVGYYNSSAKELIKNCYSRVEIVNPNTYKGPITSTTVATLNNTYYILEGSKISTTTAENIGGKKINTYVEGAKQNTYTGFDFATIWEIQEGKTTPYLKGMEIPVGVQIP